MHCVHRVSKAAEVVRSVCESPKPSRAEVQGAFDETPGTERKPTQPTADDIVESEECRSSEGKPILVRPLASVQEKTRENNGILVTAQSSKWDTKQHHIHKGLLKAESTVVTLLRMEQIGLNNYVCSRKVPDHDNPLYECGWARQTVEHIELDLEGPTGSITLA